MHERRKIIISITLSFRKFWGRESWVHQRPFATWVYKVIAFNQTDSQENKHERWNKHPGFACAVSSPIYVICPLSSRPLLPTCWPCKKFGCENISFNCLSLCNKCCFFFFSIYSNIVLGRKKEDATLFPLFF